MKNEPKYFLGSEPCTFQSLGPLQDLSRFNGEVSMLHHTVKHPIINEDAIPEECLSLNHFHGKIAK